MKKLIKIELTERQLETLRKVVTDYHLLNEEVLHEDDLLNLEDLLRHNVFYSIKIEI